MLTRFSDATERYRVSNAVDPVFVQATEIMF
jgi:hypothetical protein